MTKYKVASVSSSAEADYIAMRLEKLLGFRATVSAGYDSIGPASQGFWELKYFVHASIPRKAKLFLMQQNRELKATHKT